MDHVETLALDFLRLKSLGFSHIKVRASTLTQGMQGAGAAVAAEDFKKLLSRHGLNLIAERVEDEKTVVQLLDYSVDYAQGFLFGEPRAVRDDAPTRPGWRCRFRLPSSRCARRADAPDPVELTPPPRSCHPLRHDRSPPDFRPVRNCSRL